MIRALAEYLTDWCVNTGDKNGDREIIAYGLECRITDIVQTAVLIILALLIRRPAHVFLYCLCFTSLKQNMGGYHAPNHFLCISGFATLLLVATWFAGLVPVDDALHVTACCSLATLTATMIVKPRAHPNHPKSEQAGRKSHKRAVHIAFLQAALLIALSGLLPRQSSIWLAGAFGGMTAALTLIISRCGKGGEYEHP